MWRTMIPELGWAVEVVDLDTDAYTGREDIEHYGFLIHGGRRRQGWLPAVMAVALCRGVTVHCHPPEFAYWSLTAGNVLCPGGAAVSMTAWRSKTRTSQYRRRTASSWKICRAVTCSRSMSPSESRTVRTTS